MSKNKPATAARKPATPARKPATAKNKPANAQRKSAKPAPQRATSARKPANAKAALATPSRKPATPSRKAATPARKGEIALLEHEIAALEHARNPHNRWRPEYLGVLYSLNRHVAPYMPSNEEELLNWLENYHAAASRHKVKFAPIFGTATTYVFLTQLEAAIATLRASLVWIGSIPAWLHAFTAFKNIGFYLSEPIEAAPGVPLPAPTAPLLMPPAAFNILGLVRIIERQVEKLRAHPDWTQIIAEEFKVIPPPPAAAPDPTTLNPNARARVLSNNDIEIAIELRYRGIAGLAGVDGVRIQVDRGDGQWHDLTFTQRATFVDTHLLPGKACVWRYRLFFGNRLGAAVGTTSVVSVVVPAAA